MFSIKGSLNTRVYEDFVVFFYYNDKDQYHTIL